MKNNGNGKSNGHGANAPLRIEHRPDGVAVVWLDVPGEPVNTLKATFQADFDSVFERIDSDPSVRAVVFTSAKKDNFLAGADIAMLQAAKTTAEATTLSRVGQEGMDRIEASTKPIVAAIHGSCLGGGLELALACHGRVASDSPRTKLGVPEVQLGILPAAGGTQRLPRLIGVPNALDLMLTGKQVDARKAKKLGLVDEVVPQAILVEIAAAHALCLVEHPRGEQTAMQRLQSLFTKEELQELALAENPIGRALLFNKARKQLLEKSRGNYPAPEKILDVVRVGLEKGFRKGLEAERQAFGELATTPVAEQLMGIFFATQDLKKDTGVDPRTTGDTAARPAERVGVLGAGLMGAGVAYVTASHAKRTVRLKDKDDEGLLRGMKSIREIVDESVARRKMTRGEADRFMTCVVPTTHYEGFRNIDVVIEAVFEDLKVKHRVLGEVEAACRPDAIFASNTSSIPITRIAAASKHPETVIGMHYFSPVPKMPLLEIIVTEKTAPWVTATCVELGKAQGKTVIVVNDGVGFYTSRILGPYMNEGAFMMADGVPIDWIDEAVMDFGFPVGPMKLLDEVGIDVAAKVGPIMLEAFGDRVSAPKGVEKLVEDGRQGRKNKKGLYRYDEEAKGKREVDESVYRLLGVKPNKKLPKDEIGERCCLMMVNEAAYCFGEGILRSARDGDIGAIFGLGFPPFRGGPFHSVDSLGIVKTVEKMRSYADRYGRRFEPAPLLTEMAKSKARFYGEGAVRPGTMRAAPPTAAAHV